MADPNTDVVLLGDTPESRRDSCHVPRTAATLVEHSLSRAVVDVQGDVRSSQGVRPRGNSYESGSGFTLINPVLPALRVPSQIWLTGTMKYS